MSNEAEGMVGSNRDDLLASISLAQWMKPNGPKFKAGKLVLHAGHNISTQRHEEVAHTAVTHTGTARQTGIIRRQCADEFISRYISSGPYFPL